MPCRRIASAPVASPTVDPMTFAVATGCPGFGGFRSGSQA